MITQLLSWRPSYYLPPFFPPSILPSFQLPSLPPTSTSLSLPPSDDEYDEGEDTTVELQGVEPLPGGGYLIRLPIPSVFFKYIIGREGKTKTNIEKETGCKLKIPSWGVEGDVGKWFK